MSDRAGGLPAGEPHSTRATIGVVLYSITRMAAVRQVVVALVLVSASLARPAPTSAQVPLNPIITGDLKVLSVVVQNPRVVNGVPMGDVVVRNPGSTLWYGVSVEQNTVAANVPTPIQTTFLLPKCETKVGLGVELDCSKTEKNIGEMALTASAWVVLNADSSAGNPNTQVMVEAMWGAEILWRLVLGDALPSDVGEGLLDINIFLSSHIVDAVLDYVSKQQPGTYLANIGELPPDIRDLERVSILLAVLDIGKSFHDGHYDAAVHAAYDAAVSPVIRSLILKYGGDRGAQFVTAARNLGPFVQIAVRWYQIVALEISAIITGVAGFGVGTVTIETPSLTEPLPVLDGAVHVTPDIVDIGQPVAVSFNVGNAGDRWLRPSEVYVDGDGPDGYWKVWSCGGPQAPPACSPVAPYHAVPFVSTVRSTDAPGERIVGQVVVYYPGGPYAVITSDVGSFTVQSSAAVVPAPPPTPCDAPSGWTTGSLVGLNRNAEIWEAPGRRGDVSHLNPVVLEPYTVRVIGGPVCFGPDVWVDVSRPAAGDPTGGSGWVIPSQAAYVGNPTAVSNGVLLSIAPDTTSIGEPVAVHAIAADVSYNTIRVTTPCGSPSQYETGAPTVTFTWSTDGCSTPGQVTLVGQARRPDDPSWSNVLSGSIPVTLTPDQRAGPETTRPDIPTVIRCGPGFVFSSCYANGEYGDGGNDASWRGADGSLDSQWSSLEHENSYWQATFQQPVTVAQVTIWGRGGGDTLSGQLQFSDGSSAPTGGLDGDGCAHTVTFAPRQTTFVRFQVSGMGNRSTTGFREIEAYQTAPYRQAHSCGRTPTDNVYQPAATSGILDPAAMVLQAADLNAHSPGWSRLDTRRGAIRLADGSINTPSYTVSYSNGAGRFVENLVEVEPTTDIAVRQARLAASGGGSAIDLTGIADQASGAWTTSGDGSRSATISIVVGRVFSRLSIHDSLPLSISDGVVRDLASKLAQRASNAHDQPAFNWDNVISNEPRPWQLFPPASAVDARYKPADSVDTGGSGRLEMDDSPSGIKCLSAERFFASDGPPQSQPYRTARILVVICASNGDADRAFRAFRAAPAAQQVLPRIGEESVWIAFLGNHQFDVSARRGTRILLASVFSGQAGQTSLEDAASLARVVASTAFRP